MWLPCSPIPSLHNQVEVSVGVNDDTPGMGPLQLATAAWM